jgi:mannosyl-oligosaccharide alpha-1,2-mannosidase
MLYEAFDTPNRMPITRWEKTGVEVASGNTLVAELGSLSLEFTRLSQLTGEPKFFDAVQRITNEFDKQQNYTRLPGMWPVNVNAREVEFRQDTSFTLGGTSDSVYEYLAKVARNIQPTPCFTDSK